jgi:hypothetical protein
VRLVPVGKPIFPDQQQDLQNAAEYSIASECSAGIRFPRLLVETDSRAVCSREGSGRFGRFTGAGSLCDQHRTHLA